MEQSEGIKGVWLVTHTRGECANEPLVHTTHSTSANHSLFSHVIYSCVYFSLKMGLPSFVIYVSAQLPGEFRHNEPVPHGTSLRSVNKTHSGGGGGGAPCPNGLPDICSAALVAALGFLESLTYISLHSPFHCYAYSNAPE